MPFDRSMLSNKLTKYRDQFQVTIPELSKATGIDENSLNAFEKEESLPSGDEILILADFFRCDYKFFISNERLAAFEETDTLFRKHGDELTKEDRWAVQEVLYLSECEEYLLQTLGGHRTIEFSFQKIGNFFKGHGIEAASALRKILKYSENEVPLNIYDDFRKIGIHVFRRELQNSGISGIYIKHPKAGNCILVNYLEDVYRQRFTAAHEAAHAIFDNDQIVLISFTRWESKDLVEIRANTFASHYLMPPEFLRSIPDSSNWDTEKAIVWANKLKVSTEALAYALKAANLIDNDTEKIIKSVRVPSDLKIDPELPNSLSKRGLEIKRVLLKRGLSSRYVSMCFQAHRENIISAGRVAEMLLTDEADLREIATLYGEEISHGG